MTSSNGKILISGEFVVFLLERLASGTKVYAHPLQDAFVSHLLMNANGFKKISPELWEKE